MYRKTIVVLAICALLFVSSIDCKKVAKDKKGGKAEKAEKVKKVKAEKIVIVDEPEVVHETAPEEVHYAPEEVEEEAEEVVVVKQPVAQKHKISPPKSLKVTSAFETCKLECRKQRDAVQAADYVEQLRRELASAQAALDAENAPVVNAHHAQAQHVEPVDNQ